MPQLSAADTAPLKSLNADGTFPSDAPATELPPPAADEDAAPSAPAERRPVDGKQIAQAVDYASKFYGIDPSVLAAMVMKESSGNPDAVGPKTKSGERPVGLMQFLPSTAKRYRIDPTDPAESIIGAAAYLSDNLKRFGGDYAKAIAAHNWGEGNVEKYGLDKAPKETQDYLTYVHDFVQGMGGAPAAAAPSAAPVAPAMNQTPEESARLARQNVQPDAPRGLLEDAWAGVKHTALKAIGGVDKAAVALNDAAPDWLPGKMTPEERATYLARGRDITDQALAPENTPQRWSGNLTAGLAYAPAGAAAPLAVFANELHTADQDLTNKGVDPTTARWAAVQSAGVQAAAQMLPMGQIAGDTVGALAKTALQATGKSAAVGAGQSVAGDLLQQQTLAGGGYDKLAAEAAPTVDKAIDSALSMAGLHVGMQAGHRLVSGTKSAVADKIADRLPPAPDGSAPVADQLETAMGDAPGTVKRTNAAEQQKAAATDNLAKADTVDDMISAATDLATRPWDDPAPAPPAPPAHGALDHLDTPDYAAADAARMAKLQEAIDAHADLQSDANRQANATERAKADANVQDQLGDIQPNMRTESHADLANPEVTQTPTMRADPRGVFEREGQRSDAREAAGLTPAATELTSSALPTRNVADVIPGLRAPDGVRPVDAVNARPDPRPLPEANPPTPPRSEPLVDTTPMTLREGQQRLVVMRDQLRQQGGDPASLVLTTHPDMPGRVAIKSLDPAHTLTPEATTGVKAPETAPPVIDPVDAYVKGKAGENTPQGRAFADAFARGDVTREDVQQVMAHEAAGRAGDNDVMARDGGLAENGNVSDRMIQSDPASKPRGESPDRDALIRDGLAPREEPPVAPPEEPPVRPPEQPPVHPPEEPPVAPPEQPPTEPPVAPPVPPQIKTIAEALSSKANNEVLREAVRSGHVDRILDVLAKSANPLHNKIAELMRPIAKRIMMVPSRNVDWRQYPKAAGLYWHDDRMTLRDKKGGANYEGHEQVVAHEMGHALSARTIENPTTPEQKAAVDRLKRIYEYVKPKLAGKGFYGMKNVHEFHSEGWTNPQFQQALHDIPMGKTTAWTKFTQGVADMLGIKHSTAFTEFLGAGEALSKTAKENRPLRSSNRAPLESPMTAGHQWEMGQRAGLFDKPPIEVTRLRGDEFGRMRDVVRARAMAKLNTFRPTKANPTAEMELRNADTGWKLQLSSDDVSKIAQDKSQRLESLQSVAGIADLVERAVLAESHVDEKHANPHVQAIHRLYAPVEIAGVPYRVKLTVRDQVGHNGANTRLHALEAIDLEKVRPAGNTTVLAPDGESRTAQPTTGRVMSVSDLLAGEKRFTDGQPFARKDGGEPAPGLGVEESAHRDTGLVDLQGKRAEERPVSDSVPPLESRVDAPDEAPAAEQINAAGEPPPPEVRTPEGAAALRAVGGWHGAVAKAKEIAQPLWDEVLQTFSPLSRGTDAIRNLAVRWANADRLARYQMEQFDNILTTRYTPEEREAMWVAGDEESVIRQQMEKGERGAPGAGEGLNRLSPEQRDTMAVLQHYGEKQLREAQAVGLYQGEGLPHWTPRMAVMIDSDGNYTRPQRALTLGVDVTTTAPSLKGRKHLTADDTEAAMKQRLDQGDKTAQLVKDIRVMPLAMARQERAIAGRRLVNQVRDLGSRLGMDLVTDEQRAGYVEIKHPAFTTQRVVATRADGSPVFVREAMWVPKGWEGPLTAIAYDPPGKIYAAAMKLKGESMSALLYSPLTHLQVVFGRVFPVMPLRAISTGFWVEGKAAKADQPTMRRFIDAGLVRFSGHGSLRDVGDIVQEEAPGRSLLAKAAGGATGLVNKAAGEAVKSKIDKAGDFWHGTMLWDQVATMQMGVALHAERTFTKKLIAKSVDPDKAAAMATKMAAFVANRYTGAMPNESMSGWARKAANIAMFSRSFTLGNLGAIKDTMTGMPKSLKSQILMEFGPQALTAAASVARRKAQGAFLLDIGMMYVANSLLQDGMDRLRKEMGWNKSGALTGAAAGAALGIKGGAMSAAALGLVGGAAGAVMGQDLIDKYVQRFGDLGDKMMHDPLSVAAHPWKSAASLTTNGHNERGLEDRVRFGTEKDGTATYFRFSLGKTGEEFKNWLSNAPGTAYGKSSQLVKPFVGIAHQGITGEPMPGEKPIWSPSDNALQAFGKAVAHIAAAQVPVDDVKSVAKIVSGSATELEKTKLGASLAGFPVRKGFPGGPVAGELFHDQQDYAREKASAMPEINEWLKTGDSSDRQKAIARMTELKMSGPEMQSRIRAVTAPGSRVTSGKVQSDMRHGGSAERLEELANQ